MDVSLQADMERLASRIAAEARTVEDLRSILREMTKATLERILDAEMDVHLGRTNDNGEGDSLSTEVFSDGSSETPREESSGTSRNRRNGRSRKTIRCESGEVTIRTPRDRNGTFEPTIVPKYSRKVAGFDEKILTLFAKGLTTRDIQDVVKELYGVEVSASLISRVTEGLEQETQQWQTRRLPSVFPIVFFDGIVVHIRGANGRVSRHTIHVALGINLEGQKELLGLWINQTEGAKFWLSCLTDLKNRGLEDIFVVCVDGLTGFPDAIRAAYPQASVQLCVVHLVRAALRYVTTEDSRDVARDLKKIYQAASPAEAERALDEFAQAWDDKYPTISKQWRSKWHDIVTLFDFPPAIRKVIYTTNAIESVNSVIRKFTKNRKIYPNEQSALKLIYMAIREASKKWTRSIQHWKQALNHFAVMYEDRMPESVSN